MRVNSSNPSDFIDTRFDGRDLVRPPPEPETDPPLATRPLKDTRAHVTVERAVGDDTERVGLPRAVLTQASWSLTSLAAEPATHSMG